MRSVRLFNNKWIIGKRQTSSLFLPSTGFTNHHSQIQLRLPPELISSSSALPFSISYFKEQLESRYLIRKVWDSFFGHPICLQRLRDRQNCCWLQKQLMSVSLRNTEAWGKPHGLWRWPALVDTPAPPFIRCLILDDLPKSPEHPFSHLQNEENSLKFSLLRLLSVLVLR